MAARLLKDWKSYVAVEFDLDYLYCTAPQDYTMNQNPYPSSGNLLTLFIAEAAPVALAVNNTHAGIPNIIIANSGKLRFDIFQGPLTKNDQLTAAPFTDSFLYIPNVTASVANQVFPALNQASISLKHSEKELWGRGHVAGRYRTRLEEMDGRQAVGTSYAKNITPGYVTTDGCLGAGDDTLHAALPYYSVPNYMGSNPPNVTSDAPVDLVFVNFIESDVLSTLNSVQNATNYTSADVSLYTPPLADAVIGLYAQAKWNELGNGLDCMS